MKDNLEDICLHQYFRPKLDHNIEGEGNCYSCISDEQNKYCERYYPIKIIKYEVKEYGIQ